MRPLDAQDPTRPPCARPHATPPLPAASTHVARCVALRPSRRARRRRHRPTPPTARTALSIRRVHSPRATLSALDFPRQNARCARGASCGRPRAPQRLQRLRKRPQRSEPRQMCARAARGGRRSDIWRAGASRAEIALRETNRRWKGGAGPADGRNGRGNGRGAPSRNTRGKRGRSTREIRGRARGAEVRGDGQNRRWEATKCEARRDAGAVPVASHVQPAPPAGGRRRHTRHASGGTACPARWRARGGGGGKWEEALIGSRRRRDGSRGGRRAHQRRL